MIFDECIKQNLKIINKIYFNCQGNSLSEYFLNFYFITEGGNTTKCYRETKNKTHLLEQRNRPNYTKILKSTEEQYSLVEEEKG